MSDKTLVERLREYEPTVVSELCAISTILGIPCHDHCINCTKASLNALADAIEREYLPSPRFSNGEPVHFGDWFTAKKYGIDEPEQLKRLCIYSPELLREWGQDDGDKFAFELNYTRPADIDYRFDKCDEPELEVLDADGVPIHVGDHIWFKPGMHYDGIEYVVTNVSQKLVNYQNSTDKYPRGSCSPETAFSSLTHKQPDSLERINEDALTDVCDYFGTRDEHKCDGCRGAYCFECNHEKTLDLLKRQREVLERGR